MNFRGYNKKIVSVAIAFAMVFSGMVMVTGGKTNVAAQSPGGNNENINASLRVYGNGIHGAAQVYNYSGAPFTLVPKYPNDPQIPEKDFITHNPAFLYHFDTEQFDDPNEQFFEHIETDGNYPASEKVYLRTWYVPDYAEPTGEVFGSSGEPTYSSDIVNEYTYMLTDTKAGRPWNGTGWNTSFVFPIADNTEQIGLDGYDVNGDGKYDKTKVTDIVESESEQGNNKTRVNFSTGYREVMEDGDIQFLDFKAVVSDINATHVKITVLYQGTQSPVPAGTVSVPHPSIDDTKTVVAGLSGCSLCADVGAGKFDSVSKPWFLEISTVDYYDEDNDSNDIHVKVGRSLRNGETFYVDGAEYHVPMIDGPNGAFQYITIRNPLPKENTTLNFCWQSIVKPAVENDTIIPMLPPFNMGHDIIDDIHIPWESLPREEDHWYDYTMDEADYIVDDYDREWNRRIDEDALNITYVEEDVEPRLNPWLAEIFREDSPDYWENMEYLNEPDHYTEFVLPHISDATADWQGDYILTSAFWAPNSGNRLRFVYDPTNATDIYVNEYRPDSTLRVYGEDSYDAAFPYTDPEAPFDPQHTQAPEKDFVTFNPAWLSHQEFRDIVCGGDDANEKVFFRQWYVPHLPEPLGYKWANQENMIAPQGDIVNEYTYMFTSVNGPQYKPKAEEPEIYEAGGVTQFLFPIADNSQQIGLDSFDANNDGDNDYSVVRAVDNYNPAVDSYKDINISTNNIDIAEGEFIQFLDYKVEIVRVASDHIKLNIYYNGNNESRSSDTGSDQDELLQNGENYIIPTPTPPQKTGVIAGRHSAETSLTPEAIQKPFYLYVLSADPELDTVTCRVGRKLCTGETFFVDGAEYDVSMIYPQTSPPTNKKFGYITLRNPLPKYDPVELEMLTIWKEPVFMDETLPVLPPFNMERSELKYSIVTDVYNGTTTAIPGIPQRIVEENVSALNITFVEETNESRFNTSLLEIPWEQPYYRWDWFHSYCLPKNYTAFHYPPGQRYLLTSSLIEQNGKRLTFAHQPSNDDGIYINGGGPPPKKPVATAEVNGTDSAKGIVDRGELAQSKYNLDFTGSATRGTSPYSYEWDFDDDGTTDSTAQNPSHSYNNPGNYTVELTVTDDNGKTATDTVTVNVSYREGDVNDDGLVDSADAQLIKQHCVGIIEFGYWAELAADVPAYDDGTWNPSDDAVNAQDVQIILQVIAGVIPEDIPPIPLDP